MRASKVLFALPACFRIILSEPRTENSRLSGGKANGRLLALDLGTKRVGVAVCDELRLTVRPVETIQRRSWKDLLSRVGRHVAEFSARGLVIGLPLNFDGSEGAAASEARAAASKFQRSLSVPVYLQDERLTSEDAKARLASRGKYEGVDSEAAAIILQDFLSSPQGAKFQT